MILPEPLFITVLRPFVGSVTPLMFTVPVPVLLISVLAILDENVPPVMFTVPVPVLLIPVVLRVKLDENVLPVMFTVPPDSLRTKALPVVVSVPPLMFTVPVDPLRTTVLAEIVPPLMFTVPVPALFIPLASIVPLVFVISAVLFMETLPESTIVAVVTPVVILPVKVIKPHSPPVLLKLADTEPMFNTLVPSPNCIVTAAPSAWVRIAVNVLVIVWLAVPAVPLPVHKE